MKPEITVVPLGPGAPELLTLESAELLRDRRYHLFLRTMRHPVAEWLQKQELSLQSLDEFYFQYEDFDEMVQAMACFLWEAAADGPVALGVMDPENDRLIPALQLRCPAQGKLKVLPGVSAASQCIASILSTKLSQPPADPLDENEGALCYSGLKQEGIQLFSATDFLSSSWNPSLPLLLTEIDTSMLAGDLMLKLSELLDDELPVCFLPPSEVAHRAVKQIPLYQLSMQKHYDHTAAVFIPGTDCFSREKHTFDDLTQIVSRLRAPDGCPWDKVQTHESLRPFLVEEAWEAVNAIDDGDMDHLADELGDVLFQVFIHAAIGQAFDEFTMTQIVSGICKKMIMRHPHVFSSSTGESAKEISDGWEARKRAETGSKTVGDTLNDVSLALPALKYAIKIHKKLAQLPALRREPQIIAGEITSLSRQLYSTPDGFNAEKMGELLRKCTELCYRTDQDAEILLHQNVTDLKRIYQAAESMLLKDGKDPENLTIQQLSVYLNSAEDTGC